MSFAMTTERKNNGLCILGSEAYISLKENWIHENELFHQAICCIEDLACLFLESYLPNT